MTLICFIFYIIILIKTFSNKDVQVSSTSSSASQRAASPRTGVAWFPLGLTANPGGSATLNGGLGEFLLLAWSPYPKVLPPLLRLWSIVLSLVSADIACWPLALGWLSAYAWLSTDDLGLRCSISSIQCLPMQSPKMEALYLQWDGPANVEVSCADLRVAVGY